MKRDYVVDASVGIKLFLHEEWTDVVERVFDGLSEDVPAQLYVPELFYIECANILWKYVRRFAYPVQDAQTDLQKLRQLALEVVATDSVLVNAFDLAVKHGLTVYDACYVAMSHQLQLPLLTADERLVNLMKGKPFDIRWIGDLEQPGS